MTRQRIEDLTLNFLSENEKKSGLMQRSAFAAKRGTENLLDTDAR
jgi:hypothetical protein